MVLTIKLFATFRKGRFDVAEEEVPEGTTVAELVARHRLPVGEIGVVLVNGRHVELSARPPAGATVAIFPLLGGG